MPVFSGTVESDFEKLSVVPDLKKQDFVDFSVPADFLSAREAALRFIKAVYPRDYNNFIESDLGLMLIEMVAYFFIVHANKAELEASENVIRTARGRDNVADLLRLVGIKLKAPVGAATDAKLTLDTTPTVFTPAPGGNIVISPVDRVKTTTSPEDGAPLNFTLYKVVNGDVEVPNDTGEVLLKGQEADNSASTVFTNLVMIEGALVIASGTFAGTEAQKNVLLEEAPVEEGSLQVFVDSVNTNASGPYTETQNLFFASASDERAFQVVYGDNFQATIIFGDGTFGVSPPNGATWHISYRVGGGTRGAVAKEFLALNQNVTDSGSDLNGVLENVTKATGGLDAETVEHAKKYGPLTWRRQDRVVTLDDYTVFANTYVGPLGATVMARAVTRDAFSSANIIDIYVLEKASDNQLQRATPAYKSALINAFETKKMASDEVVINDGLIRTLDLVVTIRIDQSNKRNEGAIKILTKDKITQFFNLDNSDFGKTLALADLNRVIFEIEEVRFSSIDNLDDDIRVDHNEIIQLNNVVINTVIV